MSTANMNEQDIETEIQSKNLNAPRLSPELIDSRIIGESYYVFPNTTLTRCATSPAVQGGEG